LALLVAVLAMGPAHQVTFDESIENMFADDDPLLVPYRKLKSVFGGDEIVLLVYEDSGLLNPNASGLQRLETVSQRCQEVTGVRGVLSLDRLRVGNSDVVDPENSLGPKLLDLFENYTHGSDGKTVVVVCMLDEGQEQPRRSTIDALRMIAADLREELPPGMLAGEPVLVSDAFRYVQDDGERLGWWSAILLSATFIVCFRSIRWVVIPLVVVQLTLILTRASLALSGLRLSMVSSMLTAIVTVVGVATVAHIVVRVRQAHREGLPPREALTRTGSMLAAPIFFACVTDAIGFAALLAARVGPVRDFGLMMAIGSLFVLIASMIVVPGLALMGPRVSPPRRAWREDWLDASLTWLTRFACSHPFLVTSVALVLIGLGVFGMSLLKIESDFTKNFRSDSEVIRSYQFVEDRLGGAGVFDVVLTAPDRLDWKYLRRVLKLESRLRDEVLVSDAQGNQIGGLTKVLSLADAIQQISPLDLETQFGFVRRAMINTAQGQMQRQIGEFYDALYHEDPKSPESHYFRITLRARERQGAIQKQQLLDKVERIVLEEFPNAESDAHVTGFYVLLTNLVSSLLRDQWYTFGIAIGGMAVMMIVAFRSLRLTAIALVPNALPIVVVLGVLGWLGLAVNMGAAMIAAVSLGLSIDGSIHYLTFFRRARASGKTVGESIEDVHQGVGPALVFATLALMVGFSVLCTSEFLPTVYFGFLVSLSMLGGLIGNVVLLPALLMLCYRDEKRSSKTGAGNRGAQPAN
jgi:hypothetical protein